METSSRQPGPLAFGDFLEHLRRQGFTIGVDHHLRLQRLLASLGGRCAPQELKTLLCPVFATNEKEQQSFHRAFDSYYDLFQIPDESEGMSDLPPASAISQEEPAFAPAKSKRRFPLMYTRRHGDVGSSDQIAKSKRRFPLIYTILTALLITLAVLITRSPEAMKLIGLTPTTTPAPPPSPEPSTSHPTTPTTVASPPRAVSPLPTESDVIPTPTPTPTPQAPRKGVTDFIIAHRNAIRIAAVVIPLLCFLIYELIRYRRRKLILEKARGRKPPHAWPIVAQSPELKDYCSERFYKAARGLRRRQVGEFQRMDLARTIAATVEARGYPTFRYSAASRAPEYLILIDRASWRDHQSQLFGALARAMEREGLFTQRYFYYGDPRVCIDDSTNRAVHLTDLQKKNPSHRLLIFGDGERLIDPVSGRLASWAAMLLEWPDRALLTTELRRGLREKTLADYFILLPATLEGLGELAERFDLPTVAEFDSWELNGESPLPEPEGLVKIEALRAYLGEEAFQWLCACAVYPELHWDLTLYLGSLPRMSAGLVSEKNLLRLVRLPWFRTGSMPDELRLRLIGELEPQRERDVRSAIIELLEKNPAPQGTFAADARKLEIAAQRSWLSRDNRKELRQAMGEIKRFPPSDVVRDYALVRFLESAPSSRLALMLPDWLRKSLYKNGVPAFGLRTLTRVFSTFVIIVAASVSALLIPNPPAESDAVVVGVSTDRDRRLINKEQEGASVIEKDNLPVYVAFILLVECCLPDGTRLTSGFRTANDQLAVIRHYAQVEGIPVPANMRLKIPETWRPVLGQLRERGYIIADPDSTPDSSDDLFVFDLVGPDQKAIEAAVRRAERDKGLVKIERIIREGPGQTVHVELSLTERGLLDTIVQDAAKKALYDRINTAERNDQLEEALQIAREGSSQFPEFQVMASKFEALLKINIAREIFIRRSCEEAETARESLAQARQIDHSNQPAARLEREINSWASRCSFRIYFLYAYAILAAVGALFALYFSFRSRQWELKCVDGSCKGETFSLDGPEILIGTVEGGADIVINDRNQLLSPRHCVIWREKRDFYIIDESAYVTFVDGLPVSKGRGQLLRNKNVISLAGVATFIFQPSTGWRRKAK